jgi:TDG/mug DNA glycosylase family protein
MFDKKGLFMRPFFICNYFILIYMSINSGFAPVSTPDASILILGSMPGQKSLDENQYYAHPRNSFWPIMFHLLDANKGLSYVQRKKLLKQNKIALWDVLESCYREGSLDSDIDHSTIKANDFESFFKNHHKIKTVFFNGSKAEQLFKKEVLKKAVLPENLKYHKLPSTSPAHAAMSFDQKLNAWKVIRELI